MSNQNSPLKGFRQLKDSKTSSENPPNAPWKSSTPAPYQPPQELSSSPVTAPHQQMTICPYCSSPVPEGASFCIKCGNPLPKTNPNPTLSREIICPKCGISNLPSSSYCSNCGTPISQSGSSSTPIPNRSNSDFFQSFKNLDPKTKRFWLLVGAAGIILAFINMFMPFIKFGSSTYSFSISFFQMFLEYSILRILLIFVIISMLLDIFLIYQAYNTNKPKIGIVMIISGFIGGGILFPLQAGLRSLSVGMNMVSSLYSEADSNYLFSIGYWGMLIGFLVFAFAGYMWRSSTD